MSGVCAITVLVSNKAIPVPDSGWGKGQLLIYNGALGPGQLFAVPLALSGRTATINQLEAIYFWKMQWKHKSSVSDSRGLLQASGLNEGIERRKLTRKKETDLLLLPRTEPATL